MNILLRSTRRSAYLSSHISRWLIHPQARAVAYLSREELVRALDDQIRAKYPRSLAAEVEAVVEARRGIWGGLSGGVLQLLKGREILYLGLTAEAKRK